MQVLCGRYQSKVIGIKVVIRWRWERFNGFRSILTKKYKLLMIQ